MGAADESAPLALVIFSGAFDRVHYAVTMAAAGLAINRQVTLFFTMGAIRALLAPEALGWHQLLPGDNGLSPEQADRQLQERGAGGFEELLTAAIALGGRFMVCEMGLRAIGIAAEALRGDVAIIPGGLATFLGEAGPETAIVFI